MAVFRVQKTRDYTIMANHHLRNRTLSLKAKGLLSMILSLPDDWNYTTRGLSAICKEGVDSIGAALKELETAGYIIRNRLRDDKGRITDTEYVIFEQPHTAQPDTPSPYTENPYMDKPDMAAPDTERPAQSNIYSVIPKKEKTEGQSIHPSIHPDVDEMERCREDVRWQIEYDALIDDDSLNQRQLDEIVELMTETICTAKPVISFGGEDYPAEVVKSRLKKLTAEHIEYVLSSLKRTNTHVHNMRKYLLTALYNAPTTMESQQRADFNYQYYGGGVLRA